MPGCSNLLLLDIQKLVILIIKQNHWKFSGFHQSLYIIFSFRFPLCIAASIMSKYHSMLLKSSMKHQFSYSYAVYGLMKWYKKPLKNQWFSLVSQFISLKVHSTYVLCDQFALVSGGVDKTSFADSIYSKWKHVKRNFEIFQKILRLEIAINQRKGVKSIL